ncbi:MULTISPECIES: hypothetical protein [Rhizobium]|uniref:Uncharacterized protein n=1 Tax=Rhizobium tropici TaxID=398 RepID=A0A6P1CC48_RHITR|nr:MULTISPECIES: hypothetical protein [Rhizobium]MBB4245178.1 hypothetical protein [Rhizobium tropici]MBB5596539.1 hypothetical protein [Rhizobium tropici]MBB6495515.1 hypothetical protein [Rhizobium tropici]NEV14719.1 hypothetical protein [Rhizobium tropici]TGE89810.1 hypothetical protein C9417_29990 [Rhizobium sp. SEMIA 4088]
MLKSIIRSVFKRYGYTFLKTMYLRDHKDSEYASMSIVTEKNLTQTIDACEAILREIKGTTKDKSIDNPAALGCGDDLRIWGSQ